MEYSSLEIWPSGWVQYTFGYIKTDLIIENIMTNDNRNKTEYHCVMVQNAAIKSNPTVLYVAGKCRLHVQ